MSSRKKTLRTLVYGALAAGLSAALVLNGCEEGSATQTTTGQGLHGTLVDIHGKPVTGARVKAWPAASGPNGLPNRPDSLTATVAETDAQGRYALQGLEAGVYNLYGETDQGQASVLIPRVKYLEDAVDLGTDTLAESGIIRGKVLADGRALTPAFCYLQGSTFVALTDSSGAFALEGIPAGTYRLNYVSQGYGSELDSPVVVLSGQTVTLPARELSRDLNGQPPPPTLLVAAYDSVQGVVHLVWNKSQVADWNGYYVESFQQGRDSLALLTRKFMKDTAYTDSIGRYFSPGFGSGRTEGHTRVYRIRTVDREGNVSPVPAVPILLKVTRPKILQYSVSLRMAEGDKDTILCQDSLVFILDLDQPSKGPLAVHWWMHAWRPAGTLGATFEETTLNTSDTLVWKWNPNWDDAGGTPGALDSVRFEISTRPVGPDSRGDKRFIQAKVRPDGCFEVGRSYQPVPVPDKYGNLPEL